MGVNSRIFLTGARILYKQTNVRNVGLDTGKRFAQIGHA
jgi:hypothetical protein